MNDICEAKHGGNQQSIEAYESALPSMARARRSVLEAVRQAMDAGITAKEYAERNGRQLNTVSGRFSELSREGWIERTNRTRNRSAVWRATE
jgi:predicted transcriptional regulator